MSLFLNIGRTPTRHMLRKILTQSLTPKVECMCGRVLDAPWVDEKSRHPDCKKCHQELQDLMDAIKEYKCNLCDFTTNVHWRRDGHYESAHPICIKTEQDKKESRKWFTFIFKKKYKGHELKMVWNGDVGWIGSCICGKGKFHGVHDEILCHKQFTEHVRESEVLPIGF